MYLRPNPQEFHAYSPKIFDTDLDVFFAMGPFHELHFARVLAAVNVPYDVSVGPTIIDSSTIMLPFLKLAVSKGVEL